MAKSIDEKVVQLTLDNKQFNKASDETIDSLEKLKKSLEFEGAIDSFDELEKASGRVDFSPLEDGINSVGKSFTILDTITDTVFRNITNRIIDTGERMIKSLSTDQISNGWEKYAEQTGAVQTIMAATAQQFSDTGEQMEVVNSQLEKLTWFTDETSHKFNDMVSGIGKFTANNIDLDTSVKAMEGIATWASLSGANANEASRAIYNLAQAVSVGKVTLIDWKSIENANMGTTEFKQTVIETAEEMGTLTKVADNLWTTLSGKQVSTSNFTDQLSYGGWFTSDVLLKSLDKYGNFADRLNSFTEETGALTASLLNIVDDYVDGTLDMQEAMDITGMTAEKLVPWLEELGSEENELGRRAFKAAQETKTFQEAIDYVKEAVSSGWATSFKYIFGDYLEAKEWWSEIAETMYDAFVVGGELRNTILSMWKDNGARDDFLDGIREIITNTMDIVNIFKDAWNETWFGDASKQIKNQAKALVDLTKKFKEFAKAIKPTEQTSENLKNIFGALFSILKTGVDILKAIGVGLSPIADLLNIVAGTTLQFLSEAAKGFSKNLQDFFNADRLKAISNALRILASVLSGVVQVGLATVFTILEKLMDAIKSIIFQVQDSGGGIKAVFDVLIATVKDFFKAFLDGETVVNGVVDGIMFIFSGLAAGIETIIDTIVKLITGELTFGDLFSGKGGVTDVINGFNAVLDDVRIKDKLDQFVSWIKDFCIDLVSADEIIVGFVNNISNAIGYLWDRLGGILDTITIDDIKDLLLIAILWQFVAGLNKIDTNIAKVVGNIGNSVQNFNDVINILTKTSTPRLTALNNMFNKTKPLQIGIAVTLLVAALGKLNELDYERTQQSVAALGVTLGILLAAMKVLSKILNSFPKSDGTLATMVENSMADLAKNMMYIGISAVSIAQSMKVMNDTFFDEAEKFDWKRYAIITGGVTILMAALAGITKIMGDIDSKGIGNLVSIISLAAGIRLIVDSVRVLDKVGDIGKLAVACLSVGGIIVALGYAVKLMSAIDWKTALTLSPLMASFALSMVILTGAVAIFANTISNDNFDNALTALIVETVALTASLSILGRVLKKTPATTILSIAVGLTAFAEAVAILAGALKIIEGYNFEESVDALVSLGIGFVALASGLGVLGTILKTTPPSTIMSIGFSLIEMAGAVAILAGALKLIEGVSWESIKDATLTIAAFVGGFVALSALIAFLDVQFFGLASEALVSLSDAFLKFSLAIGVLSAAILGLSVASGIMATIVAAFQALAEKVGIDFPTMVQQGFDGLEIIIREFLEMIRNLAPDLFATFTVLFGMIALAMLAVEEPAVLAVAGIIIAIADEIAKHGEEMVDALTSIVNFINESKKLFSALEELCYHIGNFIGAGLVKAIGGALGGIIRGFADLIGIELDDNVDSIISSFNRTYQKAIESLNDPNTTTLVKKEASTTMNTVLEAWANGKTELSDQMVDNALYAMQKYRNTTNGEMRKSVDEMLYNLALGIKEKRPEYEDTSGLLGEWIKNGVGNSLDPDKPFDWFRKIFGDEIIEQIEKGVADIIDDVFDSGWDLGSTMGEGYGGGLTSTISKYWTKLITGSSKEVKNSVSNGAMKKMAEFLEFPDTADSTKEDVAESGYDIGSEWIDAIASGISSGSGKSGSAAKEAKTAAQTISESFSDELDKINRESQVSDKLFELWKAENPYAGELETSAKEIEHQSKKVSIATKKAAISQEIYQKTLEAMGESASETHDAYMDMLDDQIALLEAQNSLVEMQVSSNRFADELDKINRETEISEKLFELWKAQNPNAAEWETTAKELEYQSKKVEIATKQAAATQEIYKQTLEAMGESASQTHDAYLQMIDDQISLLEAQNELDDLKSDSTVDFREWSREVTAFTNQVGKDGRTMNEFLLSLGAAPEKILSIASAAAGLGLPKEMMAISDSLEEATATAAENAVGDIVEITASVVSNSAPLIDAASKELGGYLTNGFTTYTQEALDGFGTTISDGFSETLTTNSESVSTATKEMLSPTMDYLTKENPQKWNDAGILADTSLADGILNTTSLETVGKAALELATKAYETVTKYLGISDSSSAKFKFIGQMIDQGMAEGIVSKISAVTKAAEEVAMNAYQKALTVLSIESPSRKMAEIGKYYDLGLAMGINDYAYKVEKSVTDMTSNLTDIYDEGFTRKNIETSMKDLFDVTDDDLHMTVIVDADTSSMLDKMSILEKLYSSINISSGDIARNGSQSTYSSDNTGYSLTMSKSLLEGITYQTDSLRSMYGILEDIVKREAVESSSKSEKQNQSVNVAFNQNNYSPRSISRVDTYRDTKRLLDTFSAKISRYNR